MLLFHILILVENFNFAETKSILFFIANKQANLFLDLVNLLQNIYLIVKINKIIFNLVKLRKKKEILRA